MFDEKPGRHDFRNVSQTLILIEDARKRGIERLYNNGMARLDDLETQVRAYQPSPEEQEEHVSLLALIESLRSSNFWRDSADCLARSLRNADKLNPICSTCNFAAVRTDDNSRRCIFKSCFA